MSSAKLFWFSIAGAAALFLGVGRWQQERTRAVQREILAEREGARELPALRQQRERLAAAAGVSDLTLTQLRADHEAVVRLRGEIDGLKKRNEEKVQSQSADDGITAADPQTPAIVLPEQNWKNVGRATPAAALETALWAGSGGEVDAMAAGFALEGVARQKADALFASLAETERARFGSPEKLIAALTLKDLPGVLTVGSASVGEDSAKVLLRTQRGTGSVMIFKETEITLRRFPEGWRLVVPDGAVDNYAAALKGPGSKR